VKCECVNCGEKWNATPNNLLKGKGCKKCGHKNSTKKRTKTHEDFVKELQLITDTIIPLEEYQQALTKIKFQCLECGRIWDVEPHSILQGKGCLCGNASYGEKNITEYLTNNNIEFVPQKKFDNLLGVGGRQLSYDFYLPVYNLLIEYQGEFHDGTDGLQIDGKLDMQQEHDRRKREYSINNNINLLEIWYWDFDNIHKILNSHLTIQNY
jgi:predicted  nucleic acid-binding Zn-ribbon protein